MKNIEIERKFVIKYPDIALLEASPQTKKIEITQTYTTDNIRLRKWAEQGKITYIKTVKYRISDISRIEEENEISKQEYETLLLKADKARNEIVKTRYRYYYLGKLFEIDVFPFWQKQAFLEIELEREDEPFTLPPFVEVIREVTHDKAYRNYALTLMIPKE